MRITLLCLRVAVAVIGACLFAPAFAQQQFFADISPDDRDARVIMDAAYHQFLEGFPNGNFKPDAPLHRSGHVMVMARLLNTALKGFMVLPAPAQPVPAELRAASASWASHAVDFLAEHGMLDRVLTTGYRADLPVFRGEFLAALNRMLLDGTDCTPEKAYADLLDASVAPKDWEGSLAVPITRREVARVLENLLFFLTQHAVTEGRIVKFEVDTSQDRWVTLDTRIGSARLVLPILGVTFNNGEPETLQPGQRIRTLSDAVSGNGGPFYRVREVTVLAEKQPR